LKTKKLNSKWRKAVSSSVLTFHEWQKTAVHISDGRPFAKQLGDVFDAPDAFDIPISLIAYMVPIQIDEHTYEMSGYILKTNAAKSFYVPVGNNEKEFAYLTEAERFLWDNHVKFQYGSESQKKYALFTISLEGEIIDSRDLVGEEEVKLAIYQITTDYACESMYSELCDDLLIRECEIAHVPFGRIVLIQKLT
jgi:hypothetical protein